MSRTANLPVVLAAMQPNTNTIIYFFLVCFSDCGGGGCCLGRWVQVKEKKKTHAKCLTVKWWVREKKLVAWVAASATREEKEMKWNPMRIMTRITCCACLQGQLSLTLKWILTMWAAFVDIEPVSWGMVRLGDEWEIIWANDIRRDSASPSSARRIRNSRGTPKDIV